MTIQFLILRIQGVLSGKAMLDASQLRALASEYKRIAEDTERKLVHCASLVKAGRDYLALQVAETKPQLLESINELLFPELEAWRDYCSSHSLPIPPPFDGVQTELVKSLYTREISETHPLYKEYRRAMRTHNYEAALEVIQTIAKVNYANAAVRQECDRLQKRIVGQKFEEAKRLHSQNKEAEALELAETIREDAAALFKNDPEWINLEDKLKVAESENAKKRTGEILQKLKEFSQSGHFESILALSAEYDILCNEYRLEQSPENLSFAKAQTRRAIALQDKSMELERKSLACRSINAELDRPDKGKNPFEYLAELLRLQSDAGDMLDEESGKKLSRLLISLKVKISGIRLRRALSAAVVLGMAGVFAWFGIQEFARKNNLKNARTEVEAMKRLTDADEANKRLAAFQKKYPELAKTDAFAFDLKDLSLLADEKNARILRIRKGLETLSNFNSATEDPAKWRAMLNLVEQVQNDSAKVEGVLRPQFIEQASAANNKISSARNQKRLDISAELNAAFSSAENELDALDYFGPNAQKSLDKAAALIERAKFLSDPQNTVYKFSEADIERLTGLGALYSQAKDSLKKVSDIFAALLNADNAGDYFEALQELSALKMVSPQNLRLMTNILAKKDMINFHIAGGVVDPETAKDTPEKFLPYGIDFTGEELAAKIYKNTDGKKDVYTVGMPVSRKQSWKGGGEEMQEAAVLDITGRTLNSIFRINYADGVRPRGAILAGGALTPESALAQTVAAVSMEQSPLKALEVVVNADCSPIFKLWLEKKLIDALRINPVKSGFEFSPSIKARAEKIDSLSKGLFAHSWIFTNPSRISLVRSELYLKKAPDFFAEANALKERVIAAQANPMQFAGYVDKDGKLEMKAASFPVYGITNEGIFDQIKEGSAAKYSPVLKQR